jgi:hypothetical protein
VPKNNKAFRGAFILGKLSQYISQVTGPIASPLRSSLILFNFFLAGSLETRPKLVKCDFGTGLQGIGWIAAAALFANWVIASLMHNKSFTFY